MPGPEDRRSNYQRPELAEDFSWSLPSGIFDENGRVVFVLLAGNQKVTGGEHYKILKNVYECRNLRV